MTLRSVYAEPSTRVYHFKLEAQKSFFKLMLLAASVRLRHKESLELRLAMTKIFPVLLLTLMGLHLIKPLGLPGLKRRGDFWKIALAALLMMSMIVGFHFWEA